MEKKLKMKNTTLIILIFAFLVPVLLFFGLYKTISGYSVSFEKCSSLDSDDCWHALAHQTLNNTYCNKIKDNETKEHCFEHIPS